MKRSTTPGATPKLTAIEALATTGTRLSTTVGVEGDTENDYTDWQHPDSLLSRSVRWFADLLNPAIDAGKVSRQDLRLLREGLGVGPSKRMPTDLILANTRIRVKAYNLLVDAVKPLYRPADAPGRRWFSGTLITDLGNALEYNTIIELARVKRNLAKMMAESKLHAVGMLEVQFVTNAPQGGNGGTIQLHAHFIGYTDNPNYRPFATARALSRRSVLSNWLGAPTVMIKPIISLGDLRRWCYYLLKAPVVVKYLKRDSTKASGYRMATGEERRNVMLRLAEVLCHLTYRDAVFCSGKGGKALKQAWLGPLGQWHRRRAVKVPIDYASIIQSVFGNDRTTKPRAPIDVRRDTSRAPDLSWHQAMQSEIAAVAETPARQPTRRAELQLRGGEGICVEP